MPVIKSAKKRMKQNVKRRARNFPVRSEMKTVMKKALQLIKDGKADEIVKYMPRVYSVIDMAVKKNIIHKNNAARKKSRIARELQKLQSGEGATKVATKAKKAEKKKVKKEKKTK